MFDFGQWIDQNGDMPKRSSKKKFADPTPPAEQPPAEATAPPSAEQPAPSVGKNPAAVMLGRLGGLKGGKARAAKLTKKQRSDIAKKAAAARWAKRDG